MPMDYAGTKLSTATDLDINSTTQTFTYDASSLDSSDFSSLSFSDRSSSALSSVVAEPNDTIPVAIATSLSSTSPGTFSGTGALGDNPNVASGLDVDFFEFQLNVGDQVTIDTDALGVNSELDSVLRLFDSAGNELAINDDAPAPGEISSFESYLRFLAPVSGTYYVAVSGYGNYSYDPFVEGSGTSGTTGDYNIEIVVGPDSSEPNDTIPQAFNTGLSSPSTGIFSNTGFIGNNSNVASGLDVDFYQFQLDAGGKVTIDIDAVQLDSSLDTVLRLFDSAGNLLAFSDNDSGFGETSSLDSYLEFNASASGTYYVAVSGNSNFSYNPFVEGSGTPGSTGIYDISISFGAPSVGTFSPTGNTSTDALLNELSTYWDISASRGVITYSFLSAEAADSYYGSETVSELSEAVKNNVREILESVERFINVDFVEVADTATSYGVVRYMFSDGGGEDFYAYAYYPGSSDIGGDVHLNPIYESDPINQFSGDLGSYGYESLIHETFHAIGLKHPGNYNAGGGGTGGPYLSPEDDNNTNTVMTYNFAGSGGITPMPYDIRALQYLYGVTNFNSTDTTYSFDTVYGYTDGSEYFGSSTTELKQTLWDSGGTDTLDFSDLVYLDSGYYFDLREGGILTTQAAYNGSTYEDVSTGDPYTTSTFGTAIAYNSAIENVINSTSNDYIIANNAANTFGGYTFGTNTGNDILEGTDALDILDLSSYDFSNVSVTISGINLDIDLLGGFGSIEITDYFDCDGSMRFLIADSYYTYSSSGDWQVVSEC
jgi:hypothetical protein